jgi:hypothetical protein
LLVLLYSPVSHFATIYHFGFPSYSNLVSLQDPSIFHLPQRLRDRAADIAEIVISSVDFSVQDQTFAAQDYGLVKLIAITGDGELIEALYKHRLPDLGFANKLSKAIPSLSLPRTLRNNPGIAHDVEADGLEEFVVSDLMQADNSPEQAFAMQSLGIHLKPTALTTRSWQRLLEFLNPKDEDGSDPKLEASLSRAVVRFKHLQTGNKSAGVRLLSDLIDKSPRIDIDEDSEAMEAWFENITQRPDIDIGSVTLPQVPQEVQKGQLLNQYNDMDNIFRQSLSEQVTSRNRVTRERLIRQVVVPVVFGMFMLKAAWEINTQDLPSPAFEPAQPSESQSSYHLPGPDQANRKLSALPLPETSEPPEALAVARLRRYAPVAHNVQHPSISERSTISTILGHLPESIEEDPADYSYQQTNQRLRLLQEQIATESLDPKQKKKALKSAARLQRALERNKLMSQEVELQRTLVPGIRSGTGVSNAPLREVQSSQIAQDSSQIADQNTLSGLTMTQPERGAFGTRQPAKPTKKDKKRRAGF